jgi:hypothetical protein
MVTAARQCYIIELVRFLSTILCPRALCRAISKNNFSYASTAGVFELRRKGNR